MRKRITSLVAAALILLACNDDDTITTPTGNAPELITRVTISLTPEDDVVPAATFIDDPDGYGPMAPAAQVGRLDLIAGVNYVGTIELENVREAPAEDVTLEVEAEDNAHRVFYYASDEDLSIDVTDVDGEGRPLGLSFDATTLDPGNGTLRVVVCHYEVLPKVASQASCAGQTDIDVTFAYTIGT